MLKNKNDNISIVITDDFSYASPELWQWYGKMENKNKNRYVAGLYITATPIGNQGDITLRAIELFKEADIIACEDKRVSGKLLSYHDIRTKMIAYHDHNAQKVAPELIKEMKEGKIVAIISDAGTPMISDPGYRLVNECQKENIPVFSLPGASALLCALTSAGLPTDKFMFCGFLPPKMQARQNELKKYSSLVATLVYYETPKRILACLKDMHQIFGDRVVAVCRELTKLYEEIKKDRLSALIEYYENNPTPKGEMVVVVSPAEKKGETDTDLDDALKDALTKLSVKEAVAAVTYITGLKRKQVYKRALELAKDDE